MFDHVQGWLSDAEGMELMHRAMSVREPYVIVELGSYEGRSTCFLAYGTSILGHHRPVYAVDLWELGGQWETDVERRPGGALHHDDPAHHMAFKLNTAPWSSSIIEVQQHSHTAGKEWKGGVCVGLLFVDGGHSYDDVYGDLEMWVPHLRQDAFLCVHDYTNTDYPMIQAAVNDFFRETDTNSYIVDSMVVIQCAT